MTQDLDLIEKHLDDINKLGFENALVLEAKDVARILKVQARTVVDWVNKDIGPRCKKIGKSYIFTKRDIAEFLAKE